ncbi:MAG: hypothetical protein QXK12_04760 [Candidatus Nezhaarchaeales archaeon]
MMKYCPGVKDIVQPQLIIRTCPACGEEVEFFEYETERKCPNCGKMLYREASASCITWCQYADKCIADLESRRLIPKERAEQLRSLARKR